MLSSIFVLILTRSISTKKKMVWFKPLKVTRSRLISIITSTLESRIWASDKSLNDNPCKTYLSIMRSYLIKTMHFGYFKQTLQNNLNDAIQ